MTRERRLVFVLAGASIVVALMMTAIYRANSLLENGVRAKPRVAVVFKTTDYSLWFWQTVKDGVESASKDLDARITILGPASETQVDEQIRIIEAVISSKPDAIVLAAADYDRLVPVAREIRAARIPLVTIDSFVSGSEAATKIGTDNYAAGEKAGCALLRYVGPGDRVAIMSYIHGSSTALDRESGVRDALRGKVEVGQTLYSSGEIDIAYRQAKELLHSDAALKGIVALNDPTTIGVARALNESGRSSEVALVGFDNSLTVLAYVESGVIRDTVVQRPFNMGYIGITAAIDLIKGKKVGPFIDTGSQVIDRKNMYFPENEKLLFPMPR